MIAAIDRLAAQLGIADSYRDHDGNDRAVPPATKRALLAAFGVHAESDDTAEQALAEAQRRAGQRVIEPVTVHRKGQEPHRIAVHLPKGGGEGRIRWRISSEDGRVEEHESRFDELPADTSAHTTGEYERRLIGLPDLPTGYHRLRVEIDEGSKMTAIEAAVASASVR